MDDAEDAAMYAKKDKKKSNKKDKKEKKEKKDKKTSEKKEKKSEKKGKKRAAEDGIHPPFNASTRTNWPRQRERNGERECSLARNLPAFYFFLCTHRRGRSTEKEKEEENGKEGVGLGILLHVNIIENLLVIFRP